MLDIKSNRSTRKYSNREMLFRLCWGCVQPLFRFSPRPCFAFRSMLLRLLGARIGRRVHVYPTAKIFFPWNLEIGDDSAIGDGVFLYNLGPLQIGKACTISHFSQVCGGTHDYSKVDLPLIKCENWIEDGAWVCANAFIGPGVRVGNYAIVGAGAVVTKDVEPFHIVAGNPAKFVKKRVLS